MLQYISYDTIKFLLFMLYIAIKKKPKRKSVAAEVSAALERLNKEAEERGEQRKMRWMQLEAELHERQ